MPQVPEAVPAATIWAEVRLPGFHRWPDAPPSRAYLADKHRHLFHVRAHVLVYHDDRDTEFHDLADLIRYWWENQIGGPNLGGASCETLARRLAEWLDERGLPVQRTEVSEDGEFGAIATWRST